MGLKHFLHEMRQQKAQIQASTPASRVSKSSPECRTSFGSRLKDADQPPVNPLTEPDGEVKGIYMGRSAYPGERTKRLYMSLEEAMRHTFVAGQTGNGKTTFMVGAMLSILRLQMDNRKSGPGFAFIDPHGDAIKIILRNIPYALREKVHLIHFQDTDRPRAYNFLDVKDANTAIQSASLFVTLLRSAFKGETGNRSDYLLRNGLLSLAYASVNGQPQTLLSFRKLYEDEEFRASLVPLIDDPRLREFWSEGGDIDRMGNQIMQAIQPVIQKLSPFDSYAPIRRVVGQAESTIKFREWMDSGEIVLIDLGGVAPDVQAILGASLVTRYHFGAMSRRDIPENQRRPFILLADEIAGFASEVMADILSEDRKYHLGLVLATQYLKRIPASVLDGISGNVGSYVFLGLAQEDADRMAKMLPKEISSNDLSGLPKFHALVRMSDIHGVKRPMSVQFDREPEGSDQALNWITATSDERDGRDRDQVETEIAKIYVRTGGATSSDKASKSKSKKNVESKSKTPPLTPEEKDALLRASAQVMRAQQSASETPEIAKNDGVTMSTGDVIDVAVTRSEPSTPTTADPTPAIPKTLDRKDRKKTVKKTRPTH